MDLGEVFASGLVLGFLMGLVVGWVQGTEPLKMKVKVLESQLRSQKVQELAKNPRRKSK